MYSLKDRINYFKRIFRVYFSKDTSYLTFWHEEPAVSDFNPDELGKYYMTFEDKARYNGPTDEDGVILFDYFANIGRQYNPVAIAQYGLGNYNLYLENGKEEHLKRAVAQADYLVDTLEENDAGLPVWKHDFEWHYKEVLPAGWYSCLSQGSGISLLLRVYQKTEDKKYLKTAKKAFEVLTVPMDEGGVKFVDEEGGVWLEEYMVDPPTHILNGFLWALWGVWDMFLATEDKEARELFEDCVRTLEWNLSRYDAGFWSLYDLSDQAMKMVASPFYHSLHVVQLSAMHQLTDKDIFLEYSKKFHNYRASWWRSKFAFVYKAVFKMLYF